MQVGTKLFLDVPRSKCFFRRKAVLAGESFCRDGESYYCQQRSDHFSSLYTVSYEGRNVEEKNLYLLCLQRMLGAVVVQLEKDVVTVVVPCHILQYLGFRPQKGSHEK